MDAVSAVVSNLIEERGRGTARALAEHLGVKGSTVSRWAAGTNPPSREYWPGIEAFFGLGPGTLGAEGVSLAARVGDLEARLRDVEATLLRLLELAQQPPPAR